MSASSESKPRDGRVAAAIAASKSRASISLPPGEFEYELISSDSADAAETIERAVTPTTVDNNVVLADFPFAMINLLEMLSPITTNRVLQHPCLRGAERQILECARSYARACEAGRRYPPRAGAKAAAPALTAGAHSLCPFASRLVLA